MTDSNELLQAISLTKKTIDESLKRMEKIEISTIVDKLESIENEMKIMNRKLNALEDICSKEKNGQSMTEGASEVKKTAKKPVVERSKVIFELKQILI
ncbi:hypothetical protein HZS_3957 [Henneguya salminicola]|nr:hypothetical protein HZS_3957 [Henneguya salminicola]